jgi:hypothetical protein
VISPSRLASALAAILAGAAVLSGCGGGDDVDTAAGQPSSSTASTPAETSSSDPADGGDTAGDSGTEAPSFPANTEPDTADPSADSRVSLTDVRIGRHDGYDRVVFEVGGTGAPGWDVRYVDQPSSQGSGDPVDVEGEAALQVTLTGTGYPHDTGVEEFPARTPVSNPDAATVAEVLFDGTFEGQSVAFVGTTAQTPFRVYLLENPARVVLEVADARG